MFTFTTFRQQKYKLFPFRNHFEEKKRFCHLLNTNFSIFAPSKTPISLNYKRRPPQ